MVGDGTQLRTSEAAAQLKVSPSTVIAWCRDGLLRTSRTAGGHRRIVAQSVTQLAEVLALPDGQREAGIESLKRRNLGDAAPSAE
ncbi:MerR family DNA-binding transcriptional regulator [Micromonospora wenchangensis]|uniref:MerR family DNA-binding transcriptional regulator n=1 Tax=Micromonospora wenchangensis TaxID=1185415 RepID=UPI0037FCF9ED